jgi:Protein of unknown function (DUF2937)
MLAHPFISAVSIAVGLLFSQAPEFTQQYIQRLCGAVDELSRIVQHFDTDARRSGYDRSGALRVMGDNPEPLVRDQGQRMTENIERLARLRTQQQALREGQGFERLAQFTLNLDPPLMQRTFRDYVPALPLTTEGVLLTLLGFLISFSTLLLGTRLRRRAPPDRRSI